MLARSRSIDVDVPCVVRLALLSIVLLAGTSLGAHAQCPDWQADFAPRGADDTVQAFKVWDDGTGPALYLGGTFGSVGQTAARGIARWNGTSVTPLPDLDGGDVRAIEVFDDGTGPALYVAGDFTSIGGVPAIDVARWNGATWSPLSGSIGVAPLTAINALVVHDDGSGPALYAGGNFDVGGSPGIARHTAAGWVGVGGGFSNPGLVLALASHDSGSGPRLFAGGSFATAGGTPANAVAQWNGSAWSPVATGLGGPTSYVTALKRHRENGVNRLFATGTFLAAGSTTVRSIARFDGTSWTPLGSGLLNGTGTSLATEDVGGVSTLVVGGTFEFAGGIAARRIARWNGAAWSALDGGLGSDTDAQIVAALATFDAGAGPRLYAGGSFLQAGATPVDGLARFDGTTWSTLFASQGIGGTVHALLAHDEGLQRVVIAGGSFGSAGQVVARSVARWDGVAWSALGSGVGGPVNALASWNGAVYAGGDFLSAGGTPANRIARFDGAAWSALGGGLDGTVSALCVHDAGSGAGLYAGGTFLNAGGAPAARIARWDGATWSMLAAGTSNGAVLALAVFDDGTGPQLFAAGDFARIGGVDVNRIARWNGSTWSPLATGVSGGVPTSRVTCLKVFDDGTGPALFVGGTFSQAGSVPCVNVARWRAGAWSAVGSGLPSVSGPLALEVYDEGAGDVLVAAGIFHGGGTPAIVDIARWNGAAWTSIGTGVGEVRALLALDDGQGPSLFVGGNHLGSSGDLVATSVARWHGCFVPPAIVCVGDGSGTICPCTNHSPVGEGRGCANSLGIGARLRASGIPRLAHDTVELDADGMPSSTALILQGSLTLAAGAPFGDGLLCAGGTTRRIALRQTVAGASGYPNPGEPPLSVAGGISAPGGTRTYQMWYRNAAAFCAPSTFNLTNGVELTWQP